MCSRAAFYLFRCLLQGWSDRPLPPFRMSTGRHLLRMWQGLSSKVTNLPTPSYLSVKQLCMVWGVSRRWGSEVITCWSRRRWRWWRGAGWRRPCWSWSWCSWSASWVVSAALRTSNAKCRCCLVFICELIFPPKKSPESSLKRARLPQLDVFRLCRLGSTLGHSIDLVHSLGCVEYVATYKTSK